MYAAGRDGCSRCEDARCREMDGGLRNRDGDGVQGSDGNLHRDKDKRTRARQIMVSLCPSRPRNAPANTTRNSPHRPFFSGADDALPFLSHQSPSTPRPPFHHLSACLSISCLFLFPIARCTSVSTLPSLRLEHPALFHVSNGPVWRFYCCSTLLRGVDQPAAKRLKKALLTLLVVGQPLSNKTSLFACHAF